MVFSQEKSILFDTIYYFNIFFNKSIIQRKLINYGIDERIAFKSYNYIQYNPSEMYRAFFALGHSRTSLAVFLLFGHIERISNLNEFIDILRDREYMVEFMSNFYANKPVLKIEETFLLEVDSKTQASLLAVLTNYEIVLEKLVHDLENVSILVEQYYKDNKGNPSENLAVYREIIEECGGEIDEIEYYGISLMNPFNCEKCRKVWIFGTFASSEINNPRNLKNVTFESAVQTLSCSVYLDIIDILNNKNNYMSANQIMDYLNWSQAVLYRSLSYLCSERAILAKKEKNVNYYSVNLGYFKKVEHIMSEKCKSLYMKNSES